MPAIIIVAGFSPVKSIHATISSETRLAVVDDGKESICVMHTGSLQVQSLCM